MKFKMFDRVFDIRNTDYGNPKLSPHTKQERESLSIYFHIIGDVTNQFIKDNLADYGTGNIYRLNEEGIEIKEYKLVNTSSTHNTNPFDNKTVYDYRFDLEEVEELEIESLILGDLELAPYFYEEEYIQERDALIITAKIKISEKEMQELDSLHEENLYFDVIRKGISDEKLKMRFGQGIWSEADGTIKQELILIEEKYDEHSSRMDSPHESTLSNMREILAQTKSQNDQLMKLLVAKELVSQDEIDTIQKESEKHLRTTMRDFYRVKDLDEN